MNTGTGIRGKGRILLYPYAYISQINDHDGDDDDTAAAALVLLARRDYAFAAADGVYTGGVIVVFVVGQQ